MQFGADLDRLISARQMLQHLGDELQSQSARLRAVRASIDWVQPPTLARLDEESRRAVEAISVLRESIERLVHQLDEEASQLRQQVW